MTLILHRPRPAFALLSALVLGVGVFWAPGCDFTRVDEGADIPLQQHLEALASADTPAEAERAIRGALNKAQVRTSWQADVPSADLAFGTYFISDEQIETLARAHAAFVAGTEAGTRFDLMHRTVVEANERAREIANNLEVGVTPVVRGEIRVNAEEAAGVLHAEALSALATPEDPTSALALLATATGSALPSPSESLSSVRPLSPAQRLFYTVWLHANGPFIYPYLTEAAGEARLGGNDDCDPCCGGSGKFTSITLQYLGTTSASVTTTLQPHGGFVPFAGTVPANGLFTVNGAGRTSVPPGFRGTIGNNLRLFINGASTADATIHTSCSVVVRPGDIYGSFKVIKVTTKEGGLCEDIEICAGACAARQATCYSEGGDPSACDDAFKACDLKCHDQGAIF